MWGMVAEARQVRHSLGQAQEGALSESATGWVPLKEGEYTAKLDECPFCHGGFTGFLKSKGHSMLTLVHRPDKGVNCPARYEDYCDSQEQGAKWWNNRSPRTKVSD